MKHWEQLRDTLCRELDEIAEKGLAAHWRYKGIKSEGNLDAWMKNVRDILETAENGPSELMKNMTMDVYNKEVFVFTPKGDLYRLPLGASLLDFAFHIHTRLGCQCIGGRVNGCNRKINYKLQSGDTVEVFTSPQQQPKRDWLSFAVTSKARNKIRVTLKEQQNRAAELGRELLQRRFKNRKIEIEENILTLCPACHYQFDSGPKETREEMYRYFRDYLKAHYRCWDEQKLIYRKDDPRWQ